MRDIEKDLFPTLSWQDKFCLASGRDQAPFWNICFLFLNKSKKNVVSTDRIKVKPIQVAAAYSEREDSHKTLTIIVVYGTEGQQTARLNLKINLTNEKKTNQDL